MNVRLSFLPLFLFSSCALLSPASAAPRTHLLIFSGQSNMARLEPEQSVLPAFKAAFPEDECIVVKYAISGQSIRRWHLDWKPAPGAAEGSAGPRKNRPPGDMYKTLIQMVEEATNGRGKPDTVTFFWMQGEADTHSAAQWEVYEGSLKAVIAQMRNELQRPDMRFVIGRISDCNDHPEGSGKIRQALVAVADADSLGSWIDTDDLNGKKDGLHYTKDGYQKLGERFAAKAIEFYKR